MSGAGGMKMGSLPVREKKKILHQKIEYGISIGPGEKFSFRGFYL